MKHEFNPNYVMEGRLISPNKFYFSLNGELANNHKIFGRKLKIEVLDILKKEFGSNPDFRICKHIRVKSLEPVLEKFTAVVKKELIVHYDDDHIYILYNEKNEDELISILKIIEPYMEELESQGRFYMVVLEYGYFSLMPFEVKKADFSIEKYYNDDFLLIHKEISTFIKQDNRCGLVILHGKQGTGKTSYIRHLIHETNRKVIYLSGETTSQISEPNFISFISQHQNSIIILEDCEELLISRNTNRSANSGLINILNMCDGLLGDALSMKFICTFNAPLQDIDKALLRKGRLIARYEFENLETGKVNNLVNELELSKDILNQSLSLAELFNYEKSNFEVKKINIGFGMNN